MAKGQQRISKGFYQYSQADNFITVKNYIFVQQGDKKGLLIRFVNDSDFEADSMEYTVVQLDVNGEVIGKNKMKHTAMRLRPEEVFASDEAIIVDNRCCDFKVVFSRVVSGNYVYTVSEGKVIVDYILPAKPLIDPQKGRNKALRSFSVKRRTASRPMIALLAPIVALVLSLIFVLMYSTYGYAKKYNKIGFDKSACLTALEDSAEF